MPLALPVMAAITLSTTSSNWAGYALRRSGTTFRKVSGSWTVPAVDCSAGGERASAAWVGLGGYAASSQALEQVGTEADCSASGRASYSAWFEVVPAVAQTARLTIRPGDVVSASVQVSGHSVRMRITDATRGTSAVRTVRAGTVDVTSAEWIVEAPALCSGSSVSDSRCVQSVLTNFGATAFSQAGAITTPGHVGAVVDPAWTTIRMTLRPAAGGGPGRQFGSKVRGGAGATPGDVSPDGSAFGVDYVAPGM